MARTKITQTAFVGGELDPALLGRVDLESYYAAAGKLRNVVVLPQGGVRRRPGMAYVAATHSNEAARLVPFTFNDEETYLLVFTAGRVRVYKNDVQQAELTSAPIDGLTADIIAEMNWTQSNDVLILVHPDLAPIQLARSSDTAWTAEEVDFQNIPGFAYSGATVTDGTTSCTPSASSGTITLTAGAAVFTTDHVGQYVNINDGRVYLSKYVSATVMEGQVRIEMLATGAAASGDWQLETGYEPVMSTTRGWPRSVSFFQGRLVLGGLKSRPQTMLLSKVGDFFDFDLGRAEASDAIDVTIDDDRANVIRNTFPGRTLQLFTTGGEFFVTAATGGSTAALTPDNLVVRRATFHGSNRTRPVSVDGATLFVEANGKVIRSFLYSDVEQTFSAENLALMSGHLMTGVKRMALRRSTITDSANFLYVVNGDGTMAVLNTLRSQKLQAWTLFETTGSIEDVGVVGDTVYALVQRTINGSSVRFIERLDETLLLDAALSQTAETPTTDWANLDYLNGMTPDLIGDSYALGQFPVASGAVTAPEAVSALVVGLPFVVTVATLPAVPSFNQGAFGVRRRLVSISLRLADSGPVTVTAGKTTTQPALRGFGDGILDTVEAPFSGWLKVPLGGMAAEPTVTLTQSGPVGFHLLACTIELSN